MLSRLLKVSAVGGLALAATAAPALAATSVNPSTPTPAPDAKFPQLLDATVTVTVSGLNDATGKGYTNPSAVLEQCIPSPKRSADCDAFTQDSINLKNGSGSNPKYVVSVEPSGVNGDNGNITCNSSTACSVGVFEHFNDFANPFDSGTFMFAAGAGGGGGGGGPKPVVPESPYTVALPIGGAALLAGSVIVMRRRQSIRAQA